MEFIHLPLNEEVKAIGGQYTLVKEERFGYKGRDILYFVGLASFDTSCCGIGGCAYAFVPGFVLEWKVRKTAKGHHVSDVDPVRNEVIQGEIRDTLIDREKVHQVQFL
jgi:hypothetical protein